MNSKIGNLAKPAPQVWASTVAPKQLNLNKLSDTGGPKDEDVRRSQKPILSSFVYISWIRFFVKYNIHRIKGKKVPNDICEKLFYDPNWIK